MCEQTENNYLDGDVVWVKLGSCWWPGEVVGPEKLPPDVLPSFRKPPIAVVKFFQEETYEYVKNTNAIFRYNCERKNEFINKGLYMYRTKHGPMEKFPEDVIRAETAVGGDIEILTRDEFQEVKKESYAGLFGSSAKKILGSGKKGKGRQRLSSESPKTPTRRIKEKQDYKVHILLQGSSTPATVQLTETPATPSTSCQESESVEEKSENGEQTSASAIALPTPVTSAPSTPSSSNVGPYSCHACAFSTSRLNVLILHNKTHSVTFTPYMPSPVRKKPVKSSPKSTPSTSKTPKVRKPRKDKSEVMSKKAPKAQKRASEEGKDAGIEVKKPKTDEEIKSSLLADWEDGDDEESNDESSTVIMAGLPEAAVAAESPAVPTPAELTSTQIPGELMSPTDKKSDQSSNNDKTESSSDSKYEFCEDEDWPIEADGGRKIPRVKNPSKRKDDTKSVSVDEDEVAREVAELLNKTTVPELPSVPEPLKVEENFPEPSIVKSPDKKTEKALDPSHSSEKPSTETKPTKAIFKTKTFFRSRHSRSQDAIGKYVAEQLNAVERMDMSESEINGSDAVSSPEARDSPPIEPVKVARLAPKIQLKKMKAEAAQLREKEQNSREPDYDRDNRSGTKDFTENTNIYNLPIVETKNKVNTEDHSLTINSEESGNENRESLSLLMPVQEVLYPTPEIIPVNEEVQEGDKGLVDTEENNKENINDEVSDSERNMNKEATTESVVDKLETNATTIEFPETNIKKMNEPSVEPYMNESTASAVDALLSVSREADRVTRVISDDPPEDLFEDDNKDSGINNTINGFSENENATNVVEKLEAEQHVRNHVDLNKALQIDFNRDDDLNANVEFSPELISTNENINEIEVNHEIKTNTDDSPLKPLVDNVPTESDLQIAETLINLPSTAIQNKTAEQNQELFNLPLPEPEHPTEEIVDSVAVSDQTYETKDVDKTLEVETEPVMLDCDNMNIRFETEQEKSENLNAAQSLVQMSESIDHKINIVETNIVNNKEIPSPGAYNVNTNSKNGIDNTVEQKVSLLCNDNTSNESINSKANKFDASSSKLLKILEEPTIPKVAIPKATSAKQIIIPGKEKILNFDVAKSFMSKPQSPVIIRRTAPSKTLINTLGEVTTPDKIILTRNNKPQDGSSVQTYTMQTTPEPPSDANKITIIQQKIRKVAKTPTKLQKMKQRANSLVAPAATASPEPKILNETTAADDAMFDINSMPIVLSDDLLTPESIEKMPIVMSDGNLITNISNSPKLVKTKQTLIDSEKITITTGPSKPEVKTLVMNPVSEVSKITTPNILSKSSKLRAAKPMLVIDKTTGNKKIIVAKSEPPIKEIKQTPTLLHQVTQNTGKADKFIILPSASSPRPARTQKIVIDPQTGKAHVLVTKGPEAPPVNIPDNKQVSAKLVPSSTDVGTPGGTVMIITNAQGTQSRIVLTPEHEKILFPNKQQPNLTQLKAITQRISPNPSGVQKTVITTMAPVKPQTRIVPKQQKSTIITSKGQLIVGGRVAAPAQNIAALPEIRPSPRRIVAATEPKKIIQTVQKPSSEPFIYLQQKSGTVMQLTAAQFEHFKRTGQIVQKVTAPVHENKIIVQKTKTLPAGESIIQKQRVRKTTAESPMPAKKAKQEIAIAPAPAPLPLPTLAPIVPPAPVPPAPPVPPAAAYSDLDNFEELLPSTAIARQAEPPAQPEPAPPPAPLADGQLLAVPGEHFGGPQGSFYLCVGDNGTLTPIDNRPLVLENNQLVPMTVEPLPVLSTQPERRDILEAALANSDVFHAETPRDEAPDFRDLNANVSVHCRVSETSTTLNQPIMTPVEVPTKGDSEPTVPSNLEDGLAVIGVTPHTVPTSLELPITVTDPRIAPKTTDPLSGTNYGTSLLPSPNTEMTFVSAEEADATAGPISLPPLPGEAGKSMPILTDEVAESPGSPRDADGWRRTPGSDTSEASAEIPLQPAIQLSVGDLSRHG